MPSPDLSAEARALLRRLVQGELVEGSAPGCAELAALGLAVHDPHHGRWSAADLYHAEQTALARERAGIARHLRRMEQLSELHRQMRNAELPSGNGVEFLDRNELITAAITRAMDKAKSTIRTAHPGERPAGTLRSAAVSDLAILRRGISYRTLYPDTARSRAGEQEWVAKVGAHGAEIRTSATGFVRMILVDRNFAVVPDHRADAGRDDAFRITHPGMVALLHHVYDHQWERAEPWTGGRFRRREETLTTSRSRRILNKLREGRTLKQIASELGVSLRTVNNDLTKLYEAVGVDTMFALGAWWSSEAAAKERKLG
ncbi:LuxR C-terminal-related transcriptional regulator [Streptomyces paludis]|uniref:HTH domain-containing protein n=1 Tax=Streptomyces paludis TaxID=2282738 RepID=A0A345HRD9_9ACTN|nr:LuxR C-terminal-related transcriptional regulator [Streptomyces paludis]AXG79263.1 HTH domain-containing protein [Streptomyces paludis]